MAKGQLKGNRETKKPKQEKKTAQPIVSSASINPALKTKISVNKGTK